ncbi:MAG TPA: PQQ-binding-like beta-propeller repeat protein [Bryobacteraceae bacterium]|nr:PQQ-binding-like beta-propeller repeat protein [Bryobacteraceae bacterium]
MKLCLFFAIAAITAFAADDPYAAQLFQKHCASCHNSEAGAGGRVPQVSALKSMTPAAIQRTLESGLMKQQAAPLSPDERQRIASFLGTAVTLERRRDEIANPCPAGAAFTNGPAWAGWGGDFSNTRFQSEKDAGFSAADVPRLKLKWAFAFPDTSTMRSQPAVYRGRVFVGGQDGSVYALDMLTGCVHWSTIVQAQVRSGITVGEAAGNPALFFADSAGFVYALDATSGKQLWKARPDEHPATAVTATPVYYKGRLYVGAASREESLSISPGYLCCTFRGSESALDAATGKMVWKTYMIGEVAKAQPKTRVGASAWGPSGVGVWTAPVLDAERDTMYVTTGDNYSDPPTSLSDSLIAMRMSSGEILWSKQFTAKDAWNSSCQLQGKVNCPDSEGPDFDFASSAILVSLPNAKRALLLGQKSAVIYAVDPDRRGEILWQARVGEGGTVGGIEWGSAADGRNVYVALSDIRFLVDRKPGSNDRAYNLDPNHGGGLFALRIDNGERIWQTPPPGCGDRRPCSPAQSAAVTAIPGVVWSGAEDGHLRGYSTSDGKIIWDYDTAHAYQTVNGVAGHGGAMDVAGPVVAGGMVFAVSGYPARGGLAGNVLLAFGLDSAASK